jgi:acyl-CoA reductase-like NAD-dependent aldehyde dehydrogenase
MVYNLLEVDYILNFSNDSNSDNYGRDGSTKSTLKTINPAAEQVLNEFDTITKEQLDESVRLARATLLEWKKDIDRRSDYLYSFAKELRKNKEHLAKTAT